MNYTREQAEAVKQIVKDFMKHHDICMNSYKWVEFLNDKFPPIEVGKWIVDDGMPDFLMLIKGKNNKGDMFTGIGRADNGEWATNLKVFTQDKGNRLATEQEVLDRLSEEAKKRYKVGDRARSLCTDHLLNIADGYVEIADDFFYYGGIAVLDLSTGEWAEVVESNPLNDKIERLERELAELKQLINK
jgi:hypothetical protein